MLAFVVPTNYSKFPINQSNTLYLPWKRPSGPHSRKQPMVSQSINDTLFSIEPAFRATSSHQHSKCLCEKVYGVWKLYRTVLQQYCTSYTPTRGLCWGVVCFTTVVRGSVSMLHLLGSIVVCFHLSSRFPVPFLRAVLTFVLSGVGFRLVGCRSFGVFLALGSSGVALPVLLPLLRCSVLAWSSVGSS